MVEKGVIVRGGTTALRNLKRDCLTKFMSSTGQWGSRWPSMPVDDTPENLAICMNYCGICPSLPSPPTPFLFCARGKANAQPIERKGCTCVQCDVWKENGLTDLYFCESGKAP